MRQCRPKHVELYIPAAAESKEPLPPTERKAVVTDAKGHLKELTRLIRNRTATRRNGKRTTPMAGRGRH